MLAERQSDFVGSLVSAASSAEVASGPGGPEPGEDPALRVAILWRQRENKIKLEWLPSRWEVAADAPDAGKNVSEEELRKTLQRLLSASEVRGFFFLLWEILRVLTITSNIFLWENHTCLSITNDFILWDKLRV